MMLCSLVVWLWILLYLSPDSSRVHRHCLWLLLSQVKYIYSSVIVLCIFPQVWTLHPALTQ